MRQRRHGQRQLGLIAFSVWGLVGLNACSSPPPSVTPPPPLPEAGYSLTRCAYVLAGETYHLENYFFSITLKTRGQSVQLQAILDEAQTRLTQSRLTGADRGDDRQDSPTNAHALSTPRCIYFLSPRSELRKLPELEIRDPLNADGQLEVVAIGSSGQTRFLSTQPALAFLLRQGALSVLGESMGLSSFPARRPLSWQGAALARFAHPGALIYTDDWLGRGQAQQRRILDGSLKELSRLQSHAARARTAAALIPAHEFLNQADRSLLATRDRTPERVLLLTHRAASGEREALVELFTTSLEYAGSSELFAAAARKLFPAAANPDLHAPGAAGPISDILLLERVLASLDDAVYTPAAGCWKTSPR